MLRTRRTTRNKASPIAENALIGVLILEGALALGGGIMLTIAPSGALLQMPAEWLQETPFGSYLVPGLILSSALGVLPIFAAFALWRIGSVPALRSLERALGGDTAWLASLASGAAILTWIVTQYLMVRMFHPLQAFVFALGAAIVLLALLPAVRMAHRARPG